jgi:hypothetical protein
MLVFPEGIRLARANEIPNSPEKSESVEKIRNAQIEQGYVSQTASESLFTCYAEANVDAPQIWQVFRSLCEALLPEESMPIIGEIDEEPLHNGSYDQTQKLLALFERFNYYLANDCNIQFGLAAETDTELNEVFVTPTKHFQIWTSKAEVLAGVMKKYGIAESDELQFIDEFPRTTTMLKYKDEFQDYEDLINYLVEETEEVDAS